MRGNPGNFLGGKRWRILGNFTDKSRSSFLNLLQCEISRMFGADRLAFSIVSVGGPAKMDDAFIALIRFVIELRQTGKAAENQWQDAGRRGIERAKMTYRFFAEDPAHARHNVMRSHSSRFVDDQYRVHLSNSVESSII